jgi:hypothetical protein
VRAAAALPIENAFLPKLHSLLWALQLIFFLVDDLHRPQKPIVRLGVSPTAKVTVRGAQKDQSR